LSSVADAEVGRLGLLGSELGEDVVLEIPEGLGSLTLGGKVAGAGDVDDGAWSDSSGEQERGELDEVDRLSVER
jgi:hypothetical protein